MINNKQQANQKTTQRGQNFTNALNLETLPKAIENNAYIPALMILENGAISTPRYGGQENYLTFQLLSNKLVFGSNKSDQHLSIPLSENYHVDLSILKRPTFYLAFPTVEVYVLLTLQDEDKSYQILWSDFPKLLSFIDYLKKAEINYTVPDFYLQVFEETDVKKLQRNIERDNRFTLKRLPSLPPSTQPHPLTED